MKKTFKTCVVATFMVLFSGNIFQANTQSPLKAVSSRDANGDGKVSSDEWEKPQKAFDRIDKDGDGYLSPEDFAQHWGIDFRVHRRQLRLEKMTSSSQTYICIQAPTTVRIMS